MFRGGFLKKKQGTQEEATWGSPATQSSDPCSAPVKPELLEELGPRAHPDQRAQRAGLRGVPQAVLCDHPFHNEHGEKLLENGQEACIAPCLIHHL